MTFDNSQPPASPDNNPEISYVEDEIDIIDLIRPLWRQKILIFSIATIFVAVAIVVVLRATPQYKIYTQLKSGTYHWDKDGIPSPYMKTGDLKNLLSSGIFDTYAAEIGLADNAPRISVASTRQGNQLTASILWPDPVKGKKILAGYIQFLNNTGRNNNGTQTSGLQNQRNSLQKRVEATRGKIAGNELKQQTVELDIAQKKEGLKLIDLQSDRLKREIGRINADLKMTKQQVQFIKEHIKVAKDTQAGYEKSRLEVEVNTTKIISLRDKLLQTPPEDSLQLLLLASTIQQNIAYLNTIDQKIENTRKEAILQRTKMAELTKKQAKYHLAIADLQARIDLEVPKKKSDIEKTITKLQWRIEKELPYKTALLQQEIDELRERIKTIALVETIECPQASPKPVKPNKKKIVALAGVMGGFLAIICAYGRNFWLNNRQKLLE